MKTLGKKALGWMTAFAVMATLAVSASAADQRVLLDGYRAESGTVESAETGQLSLMGSAITKTGTATVFFTSAYGDYTATCPAYSSSDSITVMLMEGMDPAADTAETASFGIVELGVDRASFSAASGQYTIAQQDVQAFDGLVTYWEGDAEKTVSIENFLASRPVAEELPQYHKGAKVALSQPGIYYVQANREALAGSCGAIVEITGSTADKPAAVGKFTDVAADAYYHDAVIWAVEKGITLGTSSSTFSPEATCTQAQILTFLWRANGEPQPTAANPFPDLDRSSFSYVAARWAFDHGMVAGGTFNESVPCTRAMTATFLWKLAGSPETAPAAVLTDVAATSDYAQAVAWAMNQGITKGMSDTTFEPDTICTRGQIATFLYRALA